jgi:hypothetical protein
MPRNTAGGSGHKAQRNAEGSKARNNRTLVDAYLEDVRDGASTKGVYVGRILKRMGSGRMQVFYMGEKGGVEQIIVMRGGLRGKAKRTVWVDVDSVVLIAETELAGTTHEIIAVFSETQVNLYKKLTPNADSRLFLKSGGGGSAEGEDEDVFDRSSSSEEDADVDVDGI